MVYVLIALGVVMAVLMLAGVWLSCRALTETLLAPFQQNAAEEANNQDRETEALRRSAEGNVTATRSDMSAGMGKR